MIESFSKTHVECLQEKTHDHHHLLLGQIFAYAVRWTIRERNEGVAMSRFEISSVKPPFRQELLGRRRKVRRVAVERIRRYVYLGSFGNKPCPT